MRKNILIFGHNYATQFIDIYNQYTRIFDTKKYRVTVAFLTGEPNEEVRQRTLAEQVLFLNFPKKEIRTLKIKAIRKLLHLCRENEYQIVICHRYKPTYIMLWVAQFCVIPACIFVMHELGTMSARGRQLLIAALKRKNMLFAGVSNAVRDDMRHSLRRVPQERVVTLYNMIDFDLIEPTLLSREEARKALHLPEDAFVFGNLARLAPNKDQETLIAAFARMKPDCPKAKLLIVGDGPLEATLKSKVDRLGLTRDIIFTGYLSGALRYMKGFDCFTLSSIQEAFGRVLLEAMIARLPIIATRVHGIPEVVGDAGILTPPRDAKAYAEAMQRMYTLSQLERIAFGDKAYQRAYADFSIPRFNQKFWQLSFMQELSFS